MGNKVPLHSTSSSLSQHLEDFSERSSIDVYSFLSIPHLDQLTKNNLRPLLKKKFGSFCLENVVSTVHPFSRETYVTATIPSNIKILELEIETLELLRNIDKKLLSTTSPQSPQSPSPQSSSQTTTTTTTTTIMQSSTSFQPVSSSNDSSLLSSFQSKIPKLKIHFTKFDCLFGTRQTVINLKGYDINDHNIEATISFTARFASFKNQSTTLFLILENKGPPISSVNFRNVPFNTFFSAMTVFSSFLYSQNIQERNSGNKMIGELDIEIGPKFIFKEGSFDRLIPAVYTFRLAEQEAIARLQLVDGWMDEFALEYVTIENHITNCTFRAQGYSLNNKDCTLHIKESDWIINCIRPHLIDCPYFDFEKIKEVHPQFFGFSLVNNMRVRLTISLTQQKLMTIRGYSLENYTPFNFSFRYHCDGRFSCEWMPRLKGRFVKPYDITSVLHEIYRGSDHFMEFMAETFSWLQIGKKSRELYCLGFNANFYIDNLNVMVKPFGVLQFSLNTFIIEKDAPEYADSIEAAKKQAKVLVTFYFDFTKEQGYLQLQDMNGKELENKREIALSYNFERFLPQIALGKTMLSQRAISSLSDICVQCESA